MWPNEPQVGHSNCCDQMNLKLVTVIVVTKWTSVGHSNCCDQMTCQAWETIVVGKIQLEIYLIFLQFQIENKYDVWIILIVKGANKPFPRYLLPVSKRGLVWRLSYENEFDLQENEHVSITIFHNKGFTLGLVLKQRQQTSWK